MIPHLTKFANQTSICTTNHYPRLSNTAQQHTLRIAAFNQADSREKLLQVGKQPLSFAIHAKTAFFTLAIPLHCLSSMANKGKARFIVAATTWQFLTPYPLFATPNREKFWAVCNQVERHSSCNSNHSILSPLTLSKRAAILACTAKQQFYSCLKQTTSMLYAKNMARLMLPLGLLSLAINRVAALPLCRAAP